MSEDDLEKRVKKGRKWYGRPHYKEFTFIEVNRLKFLIAQHEKEGQEAVYSEDGRNDWFGGPHDVATPFFVEIEGELFFSGEFLDDIANDTFYSLDGFNFLGKESIQSSRYGIKRQYDKTYYAIRDGMHNERTSIQSLHIDIVEKIVYYCLLDKAETLVGVSYEEMLTALIPLFHYDFKFIPQPDGNYLDVNVIWIKLFDYWLFVVDKYSRGGKNKVDFGESISVTVTELLECASINLERYQVLRKFISGDWSNLYLIIDDNETDDDFIKVLKVPAMNLADNDNVARIVSKYSLEQALEEVTKEERRINSKTSSTSTDAFKNFHYRPIPQFFEMQEVSVNDKKVPALIYEYIRGCDFDEYFSAPRTEAETIETLARAAYAVNYIHTKGFTHNDLKGDNVMVAINGNVYVLDLAFSRIADSTSTIKGVRATIAPERILGGVPVDEKADQYSYGIMMYRAVVGQMPMSYEQVGGDKQEFARQVHDGTLKPDFNVLRSKVIPELAVIIERCMAFNPADRYNSMQEVEDALVELRSTVGG